MRAPDASDLAARAGRLLAPARRVAEREARALGRELTAPWRTGREGPVAETGRWIGAGLAVGAFVFGVLAAMRASRRG